MKISIAFIIHRTFDLFKGRQNEEFKQRYLNVAEVNFRFFLMLDA
jgi:hypothetical protein